MCDVFFVDYDCYVSGLVVRVLFDLMLLLVDCWWELNCIVVFGFDF